MATHLALTGTDTLTFDTTDALLLDTSRASLQVATRLALRGTDALTFDTTGALPLDTSRASLQEATRLALTGTDALTFDTTGALLLDTDRASLQVATRLALTGTDARIVRPYISLFVSSSYSSHHPIRLIRLLVRFAELNLRVSVLACASKKKKKYLCDKQRSNIQTNRQKEL